MNKEIKLTIIIPAYNEEADIGATLHSLLSQLKLDQSSLSPDIYQVVIVDNNSTDATNSIAKSFDSRLKIHVIKENTKGVVPSRIAGFDHILNSDELRTPYLASGDADVIFHQNFVDSVVNAFDNGMGDVLSIAGCFPDQFWKKIPRLADKYLEEIGTIFFPQPTIERLKLMGKGFKFTEKLFFDFGRPVSDSCFAITTGAYLDAGGYTREFRTDKPQEEVFGEGWRLSFVLERMNKKFKYINEVPYSPSPRRLLKEPEKFLDCSSYEGSMNDLRDTTLLDDYSNLNRLAEWVSLAPVQKYIVDYYILLRCITRPELVRGNSIYFGNFGGDLKEEIDLWWKGRERFEGHELFDFSEKLGDRYRERIMNTMPLLRVGELPGPTL